MPRRHPRPTTMPPARRMVRLLGPEDIRTALAAAGYGTAIDAAALSAFVEEIDRLVQAVLTAQASPPLGDARATAAALSRIAADCAAVMARIGEQLTGPIVRNEPCPALEDAVIRSQDPLIIALVDAAASRDCSGVPERRVADTLRAVDRLRDWAEAAATQHGNGAQSQAIAYHMQDIEDPGRVLVTRLIEGYQQFTGRAAGLSRDAYNDNAPGGPLVRYLTHLFGCIRAGLPGIAGHAGLARDRFWKPAPETLATWIDRFRASPPP